MVQPQKRLFQSLAAVGPSAVPSLARFIDSGDTTQQIGACEALAAIGPDSPKAVPILVKLLNDTDESVQRAATEGLGQIGVNAVPALVAALKDSKTPRACVQATSAIALIGGPAVPNLVPLLEDNDKTTRMLALDAIVRMGTRAGDGAAYVVDELEDPNEAVRERALKNIEKPGVAAIPALFSLITRANDYSIKSTACASLTSIRSPGIANAVDLGFSHPSAEIRALTCLTLALNPKSSAAAVPRLKQALNDSDENVRSYAALAIGSVASKDVAVPLLTKALDDESKLVRAEAITALCRKSSKACLELVPRLKAMRDDDSGIVRVAVAKALWYFAWQHKQGMAVFVAESQNGTFFSKIAATLASQEIAPSLQPSPNSNGLEVKINMPNREISKLEVAYYLLRIVPPAEIDEAADQGVQAVSVRVLRPTQGVLRDQLRNEAEFAQSRDLTPLVMLHASWCPSCNFIRASLHTSVMSEPLKNVHLVRVDVDEWQDQIRSSGLKARVVPTFLKIDNSGQPMGEKLEGNSWGSDTTTNISTALRRFLDD